MKVLIAYGTTEGQTAHIADELKLKLQSHGADVEATDLEHGHPNPSAYDRIVLAGSIHVGKYQKEVDRFISENVELLNKIPSWFIGVSLSEAGGDKPGGHEAAQAIIDTFVAEHGWRPRGTLSLAGALKYRQYNFLKRMVLKRIAAAQGGDTDTSRDWEYTDWSAVERLANDVAATPVGA